MTRKGYEMFAKYIKEEEAPLNVMRRLAVELAAMFKIDNPRFDKHKFYKACGMEDMG